MPALSLVSLARQTSSCPQMTSPLSIAVFLHDKVHANGSNGLSRHRLFRCWINSVFCPVGRKVDRYACLEVDTADATPRKRLKLFVSPSKALGGAADTNVEGFWDNPNVSLLKNQKQSILSWSSTEKDQRFNMDSATLFWLCCNTKGRCSFVRVLQRHSSLS